MKQRVFRLFIVLIVPFSAALSPAFLSSQESCPPGISRELAAILTGCAAYCERLENSVLDFVCLERMHEQVFRPHLRKVPLGPTLGGFASDPLAYGYQLTRSEKTENEFVYDYQLVRKGGRLDERRTLIRENGHEKREEGAQLKTVGFRFKNIIFGPIVLLGREWQSKHSYEIIGNAALESRPAVVIKATPRPGEWLGYLFGTVWVDREDFGVLRIEWSQESLENYGRLRSSAQDRNFKPDIVLAGEYGYEKNGLRFPSRFDVDERYVYSDPLKFSLYKLAVVFSDYKFFTVETEVKY